MATKLIAFRNLLIKKASNSADLQSFLRYLHSDVLSDITSELLEKAGGSKGYKINHVLNHWATHATDADAEMARDAIGHHLSRYKAALANGNRDVANKHVAKAMSTMNLMAKAAPNSHGKLNFSHLTTNPWELNFIGHRPDGKKREVHKDLNREVGTTRFPDHRYLELPAHPLFEGSGHKKLEHEGAYPFEEVKVNGRYVSIDKNPKPTKEYEPHVFDSHPVHKYLKHSNNKAATVPTVNDENWGEYVKEAADWENSPELAAWHDKQEATELANPASYASRGQEMSDPAIPSVKRIKYDDVSPEERRKMRREGSAKDKINRTDLPPELQDVAIENDPKEADNQTLPPELQNLLNEDAPAKSKVITRKAPTPAEINTDDLPPELRDLVDDE